MRHLWIASVTLLAGCFTDAGAITTSAGATSAATTADGTTTAAGTTSSGATDTTSTSTSDTAAGTTTGVDATTASLTSGATTGDATSDTTSAPGTSTGTTTGGSNDLPVPGCDPLYFNDFTQNSDGLTYDGGGVWSWNQGAGELTLMNNGGSSSAWIPDAAWKDYVAYTRVRFDNGTGYASLRARGKPNTGNYYYASPSISDQVLVVGITAGGQFSNQGNAPVQLEPGTWYLLRFDVVGDQFAAQLEGATAKFADAQFIEGSAGIGGFSIGTFTFDWLLLCKP